MIYCVLLLLLLLSQCLCLSVCVSVLYRCESYESLHIDAFNVGPMFVCKNIMCCRGICVKKCNIMRVHI